MRVKNPDFPLVYSCSGCSSAAQTANYAALQLDRRGVAEMSCIAGIGGDVPQLVRIAKSGRPIIALDGCPLACTRSSLARHDLQPTHYHQLNEYGVKKRVHVDFDKEQGDAVVERVVADLEAHRLANSSSQD